jgi:hypothetical protein
MRAGSRAWKTELGLPHSADPVSHPGKRSLLSGPDCQVLIAPAGLPGHAGGFRVSPPVRSCGCPALWQLAGLADVRPAPSAVASPA